MRDKRCFLFVFFLLIHRNIGSMQGTVCIGCFRIDFYYAKTGTGIIQINITYDILHVFAVEYVLAATKYPHSRCLVKQPKTHHCRDDQ